MRVSLPMYGINRDDVELLWQGLSRWLAQEGEEDLPPHLCWPDDLYAHWQQPDLLLSQTCGYPLQETLSAKVDAWGCFAIARRDVRVMIIVVFSGEKTGRRCRYWFVFRPQSGV